ncbi:MAG: hypothetical protein KDE56_28785 [Anaerolineales bacterium]|nr:hypothetical protein [Anaerolineales bacterium]
MRKPPLYFGQGPPAKISINPSEGGVGTTFYVNATGFVANTPIKVEIYSPHNALVMFRTYTTDSRGSIGYANVSWSSAGQNHGNYLLRIYGTYRQDKKEKEDFLELQFRIK